MKNIIEWIAQNWQWIVLGAIALASMIVRLTKTTSDNKVVVAIINALEKISIFNTDEQRKILEKAKEIAETEK